MSKYARGSCFHACAKLTTFCTPIPPSAPAADTVPKPMLRTCSGQSQMMYRKSTPQQQLTQQRERNSRPSLTDRPVPYPYPPKGRQISRQMQAIPKEIIPVFLLSTKWMNLHANIQTMQSGTLSSTCTANTFPPRDSMAALGPRQRLAMQNSMRHRYRVFFFREGQRKRSIKEILCVDCRILCPSSRTALARPTSSSLTLHSRPFMKAILLKLARTAAVPFEERCEGVSSSLKTTATKAREAGMRQQMIVTVHQSLRKQQEAAIANPATPNALWRMIEQACRR